ncbi:hypothetical protein F4703DRAFT_1847406 [Phycomyces blakesleeanus]
MDLKTTRDNYNDTFAELALEKKLEKEEERLRKRIKIKQTQSLCKELDAEIDHSSTAAEEDTSDIDSGSSSISPKTKDKATFIQKTIYEDAEELHNRYKQNDDLSPCERKRMCAGLSGILDTADDSYHGQKELFNTDKWDFITKHYSQFTKMFLDVKPHSNLDALYKTWDSVYGTLSKNHSYFKARQAFNYISIQSDIDEHTFKQLQIIDFFLDTLDSKQFIINPKDATKVTEKDYESQIWIPLFTRLFNIKNNNIRIKSGESVPPESTKKKAEQYGTDKNIIGFKIDFRLVFDYKELEIDLASAEVSVSSANEAKERHDESKLVREAMISTEAIHHILKSQGYVYTWAIKICGLTATFSSLMYDDERMIYVNVHQFILYFPTCISELEDLKDDLEMMFKFKEDVERIGYKIEKSLKRSERKGRNVCPSPERKPAPCLFTYFTPPRNEAHRSIIPINNNTL